MNQSFDPGLCPGIEKGKTEGIIEGYLLAMRHLIKIQLKQKFHSVPLSFILQIECGDITYLTKVAVKIISAKTLDEVFTVASTH